MKLEMHPTQMKQETLQFKIEIALEMVVLSLEWNQKEITLFLINQTQGRNLLQKLLRVQCGKKTLTIQRLALTDENGMRYLHNLAKNYKFIRNSSTVHLILFVRL